MGRIFLNFYLFTLVLLLLLWFAAVPLVEQFAAAPFRQEFNRYYRELMRGSFSLLQEELEQTPRTHWKGRLEDLQPRFGYPLALVPVTTAELTAAERETLAAGDIVVGEGYDQFWQRVGNSDRALVMGPFPEPSPGRAVDLATWLLVLLLLALGTTGWALPLWRQLRRIDRAATEFGRGELSARVAMPRRSAFAPLAATFNRMAARIEQLVSSHRDLTNAVSHELRTPLSRLRFGLEMAESTEDPHKRQNYLAGAGDDIAELEGLVEQLLIHARFERRAAALALEERPIAPWLHEILDRLETSYGVILDRRLGPDATAGARFDPAHLAQAVGNLVQNADRYGNGQVRVVLEREATGWLLSVEDDGPGIPPAERERIFEPFTRLDASRSRAAGGHGLGLAIVARIARAHNGRVEVRDSDLGGSSFALHWPG